MYPNYRKRTEQKRKLTSSLDISLWSPVQFSLYFGFEHDPEPETTG
jgi:hypothetical protein